ncbi:MAG: ABC transporter permease [Thermoanaerobaculia bacterium]
MRLYRLLLRLYPSSFRGAYGDELSTVFAERTRHMSAPRKTLTAIGDAVPNALAVHGDLLVQDLRYAIRSLFRAPGFAITAILVAALGIGANTTAFSLADFVLVRPLPFPEPDRLLKLWEKNPVGRNVVSPLNFRDWREQSRSFEKLGAYTTRAANLVGMGDPRQLEVIRAMPEVLPIVGVAPLLGRHFTEAEARNGAPLMLSYALWQSQFGGAPDVVGRVVRVDGVPHTIVGVMPSTFQFPRRGIEAWSSLLLEREDLTDRTDTYLEVIGRLRKGVTVEQARKELELIAARLARQYPADNKDISVHVWRLRDEVGEGARMLVLALCGAALCILLLSCANLASLFLVRGASRAREMAVRSALGAGRERLVRQLVTESFVIAILGGIVGVALATASVPLLARLVPATLPIAEYPNVDLRVLGVAAAFVVLTGLAFGVLPAVRAGGRQMLDALRADARSGGGRTQRLRSALVIVEIVASVVLLISSGLLIRAVWNIQNTKPGFRPDHVLALRTALPLPKYDPVAKRAQFYDRVLDGVRALPGVQGAAYVSGVPMQMRGGIWAVAMPGQEEVRDGSADVSLRFVTPQFFSTLGIPFFRGRDVATTDDANHPYVAVVSESFAKRHWPGQDAIGKQFKVAFFDRTIVGVVGDVRVRGLERTSEPQIYLPYKQVADGSLIGFVPKELVVRSTGDPDALVAPIRDIVRRVDPEQPVSNIRTFDTILDEETASRVTQVRLLSAMAAIALLIAAIGIHGLLAYTVSLRWRELGVRLALGAQTNGIVRLVLREGLVLAAIGIAGGMFLAYLAARSMGALLAGIRPMDPVTFAVASALCFLTVLAGCVRPALRAAQVDPMTALRAE